MMGIVDTCLVVGACAVDNTLHYLHLLLFKVALNIFLLAFCVQTLGNSFMDIFSISLCMVDGALLCGISYLWLFQGAASNTASTCFLLGHASVVYSMLPLPVVLLGGLDYAQFLCSELSLSSTCRKAVCCLLVSLLWIMACVHSYLLGDPKLAEVQDPLGRRALLCPVEDSSVVICFCGTIVIGCIVLLFCHGVPDCVGTILHSLEASGDPPSGLLPSEKLQSNFKDGLSVFHSRGQDTPLSLSLTIRFMVNWTPFLLVNITCELLDYTMPAYITVNLLWLLCAKTLLVSLVFWASGGRPNHFIDLPDDSCVFRLSWHTGPLPKDINMGSGQKHGAIMHV